jgi:hypothetical protein
VSSGKSDEDDRGASRDVDDEVIRSSDHGERHRERREDRERPDSNVRRRHEQDDSHREVPADVQARERGVLVREAGRLERAVGVRLIRHGVDEAKRE